jgi:hypothetical protein
MARDGDFGDERKQAAEDAADAYERELERRWAAEDAAEQLAIQRRMRQDDKRTAVICGGVILAVILLLNLGGGESEPADCIYTGLGQSECQPAD